jgi:hypothetical protein
MKGMSGQKKKGFRVASGQHSECINASASKEVHGAEPCVIGQTPLYACKEQYDVFYTFALQSAPMSKGSDTSFVAPFIVQRVGFGILDSIGCNWFDIKDAKNKACT